MSDGDGHLSTDQLLAYWLHETGPQDTDAADEHLMQCDRCGGELDALVALGSGVRQVLLAGGVMAAVSGDFARRLASDGLRTRSYRLAAGGSVHCTAAPADEILFVQLDASLDGIERLDAVATTSLEPGVQRRITDIPFDAAAGAVYWVEPVAHIRALPAHEASITLLAAGPGPERVLGRYTFRHQPWAGS